VSDTNQVQGAEANDDVHAAGLSVEFVKGPFEIRAEGFRKAEGDASNEQKITTGYVEAAAKLPYGFQVAARAESATYALANDTFQVCTWIPSTSTLDCGGGAANPGDYTVPNSLRRHIDLALGLNYWFNDLFVVKASYHWINGNRFAVPEYPWNNFTVDGIPDSTTNYTDVSYDSKTQMLLIGAQFAF
jgi:hypothetical protein